MSDDCGFKRYTYRVIISCRRIKLGVVHGDKEIMRKEKEWDKFRKRTCNDVERTNV